MITRSMRVTPRVGVLINYPLRRVTDLMAEYT